MSVLGIVAGVRMGVMRSEKACDGVERRCSEMRASVMVTARQH
jgi:hypothetical protein